MITCGPTLWFLYPDVMWLSHVWAIICTVLNSHDELLWTLINVSKAAAFAANVAGGLISLNVRHHQSLCNNFLMLDILSLLISWLQWWLFSSTRCPSKPWQWARKHKYPHPETGSSKYSYNECYYQLHLCFSCSHSCKCWPWIWNCITKLCCQY